MRTTRSMFYIVGVAFYMCTAAFQSDAAPVDLFVLCDGNQRHVGAANEFVRFEFPLLHQDNETVATFLQQAVNSCFPNEVPANVDVSILDGVNDNSPTKWSAQCPCTDEREYNSGNDTAMPGILMALTEKLQNPGANPLFGLFLQTKPTQDVRVRVRKHTIKSRSNGVEKGEFGLEFANSDYIKCKYTVTNDDSASDRIEQWTASKFRCYDRTLPNYLSVDHECPKPEPTAAPTPEPTSAPTSATSAPIAAPIAAPIDGPIDGPTAAGPTVHVFVLCPDAELFTKNYWYVGRRNEFVRFEFPLLRRDNETVPTFIKKAVNSCFPGHVPANADVRILDGVKEVFIDLRMFSTID